MKAKFYIKQHDNEVLCNLCPHACFIKQGDAGFCGVRYNNLGILESKNYGLVSSIGFDPIEKKPLYHFYPGSEILSVGSIGCNLKCSFCQNWQISQCSFGSFNLGKNYSPKEIIEIALSREKNLGIAYTYNEPVVFYEYMLDMAILVKENGLANVMVTNGYISQSALHELIPYIDAFNVDLKSFNNDFYKRITKSSLEPVLKSLQSIVSFNKHLEITYLIIPNLNDSINDFKRMLNWIKLNLGEDIVLHLSRYFPRYNSNIAATPEKTMNDFKEVAEKYLHYVYLGNIETKKGANTYCTKCNKLLIERTYYSCNKKGIDAEGKCEDCKTQVIKHI